MVKRFEVFMCDDHGKEKPCLVVSPDEMNAVMPTLIIAPITQIERRFPTRIAIGLKGKKGQIALEMIKTVDKSDLTRKIGVLPESSHTEILGILGKIFGK